MKKISDLIPCPFDVLIKGITEDSREVKQDFLFVATHGFHVDHYDYIKDAIENGCSFVICDREIEYDIPHLVVSNVDKIYRELCQKFYDVNLDEFHFIGVTGTDGKTTTSTIISRVIGDAAYLGTNGLMVGEDSYDTHNTTPCLSELYEDFAIIKKHHCQNIAMEVSSEALLHNRVSDIFFDIIGFTNITGDHLAVHGSFQNYVDCKMKLLDHVKENGIVILNGDDPILKTIQHPNKISFGFSENNDYVIQEVTYLKKKTLIKVHSNERNILITSPLFGKYNVYNVVMGYLMGLSFGLDQSLLLKRIEQLGPIKGRGEFLDFGQDFDIVLDYAHTINGVRSILDAFQDYENIIVVTGCAGGRDVDKRSIIGKMVLENSDIAIFTMDDPRFEDVDDIIDQMVGESKDYFRIVDREDAIYYALSIAYPGSVVLILGKGRDNYMAIKDKKIHYSDYEVISHYFQKE